MKMTTNNIPQGKVTPLGIIPNEWEILQLKKLGKIYSGGTPNTNEPNYWNGNILWCTPSDITKLKTRFIGDTNQRITPLGLKNSSATLLPPGSILVCTRATIGNAAITIKETSTNQGFKNIKPIKGINVDWLFYYITLNKHRIVQLGVGSTFLEVSKKDFENFKIIVPPFPEQQKIAEVLSTWDKAIEKQSQLIEKLELRKKGLMQQLLTGKKRLPGFSSEWEEVKLWEIGTFFKGAGVPKDEISSSGAYKCLTYGDIYTKYNTQIKDVKCFISQETAKISKKIEYGDICFASSGETLKDIGKCAVFVDDNIGYAGGDIIIFRKNIKTNPILLAYILNSEYVNKQKYSVGQGHSVVHIYIHNLEKIKIKIPYIKEQSAITELLSYCDKEIKLAYQKLKILKQQKKGLMQVLLTGKKRIIQ